MVKYISAERKLAGDMGKFVRKYLEYLSAHDPMLMGYQGDEAKKAKQQEITRLLAKLVGSACEKDRLPEIRCAIYVSPNSISPYIARVPEGGKPTSR